MIQDKKGQIGHTDKPGLVSVGFSARKSPGYVLHLLVTVRVLQIWGYARYARL